MDDCPPNCAGFESKELHQPGAAPAGCRVVDELSLLFDISYTLESSLELRDVIRPVLLKLADVLGMKRGAIVILNRDHGKVTISEAVGLPAGQTHESYLQACHDLIQQVIQSGQALVVPDISREPALNERWRQESGVDPRAASAAYICVPIKFGEEVVGVLSVERLLIDRPRLSADRRLLSLIANVIAQTVHFHRVTQERLASLQRENERLQQQIQTSLRPKNIIGNSNAMRSVFLHIEQVANSNTTVLIRGESGVG